MTRARPAVVVLVAGTGTDVGKTWLSARLLETWRRSRLSVAARKPAQSFAPDTDAGRTDSGRTDSGRTDSGRTDAGRTDAEVLATASGEDPTTVCLPARWYPVALAPPMAAAALGLPPPTIADLVAELAWPTPSVDIGLVETAGGVMSPQAADGDVIDMAVALAPDHVLLVADAGLGTLNAVRLTVAALAHAARHGPPLPAPHVVLNRYDPGSDLHRRNLAWLRDVDALSVSELSSAGVAPLAARLTVREGSVTGGAGPN